MSSNLIELEQELKRGTKRKKLDYSSPLWRNRKKRYYKTHDRCCAVCGQRKPASTIHLHHLRYSHPFGREPDGALVPLCKAHHNGVHAYAVSVADHYDLEEATRIYIRLARAGKLPLRKTKKKSYSKTRDIGSTKSSKGRYRNKSRRRKKRRKGSSDYKTQARNGPKVQSRKVSNSKTKYKAPTK